MDFAEDTVEGLTALEQRQQTLAHMVKMVARKVSHALFVFGAQGGLGKSRTILRTLDEEGIVPVLINSHVTPLSLYGTLFQHRQEAIVFFDDVDSMFSSMAHLGLLRSALWGSPRIVTYGSSQLPSDYPPSFEFTSRCIFAANVIPSKNDAFKAVLSRCDIYELSATNEEVLELMRCVSVNGFHGLTPDDCSMVIDFIAENSRGPAVVDAATGPIASQAAIRSLRKSRLAAPHQEPVADARPQAAGNETARHPMPGHETATGGAKEAPGRCQEPNGLFLPAEWQESSQFLSGFVQGQG